MHVYIFSSFKVFEITPKLLRARSLVLSFDICASFFERLSNPPSSMIFSSSCNLLIDCFTVLKLVGIVDTNNSPVGIDYIIPGNDDSIRAIELFASAVSDAVIKGRAELASVSSKDEFIEVSDDAKADNKKVTKEAPKVKVVKKVSKAKIASDSSDEVNKEDNVSEKGSEADKADVPTLKVESTTEDDPSQTKTDDKEDDDAPEKAGE